MTLIEELDLWLCSTVLSSVLNSNSYILYSRYAGSSEINRFDFVKDLVLELIAPYMRRRLQQSNLPRDSKGIVLRTAEAFGRNAM